MFTVAGTTLFKREPTGAWRRCLHREHQSLTFDYFNRAGGAVCEPVVRRRISSPS